MIYQIFFSTSGDMTTDFWTLLHIWFKEIKLFFLLPFSDKTYCQVWVGEWKETTNVLCDAASPDQVKIEKKH